jgi:hypothetical protein
MQTTPHEVATQMSKIEGLPPWQVWQPSDTADREWVSGSITKTV